MKFRFLTIPLMIMSLSTALVGCSNSDEKTSKINNEKVDEIKNSESETLNFNLYFDSSSAGDSLSLNKQQRSIKIDDLLAKAVLDELIKGPDMKTGTLGVLPKTLKIASLSIKDSIAYVNFDNGSEVMKLDKDKEELALKAIVTTLTDLDTIDSVKITIPSNNDETFAGNIDISKPLSDSDFNNILIK